MADSTWTIRGVFETSDVLKGIAQMKSALNSIDFGGNINLEKGITKPLSEAERQIAKISQLLSGNFANASDVASLGKAFTTLQSSLGQLEKGLYSLDKIDLSKIIKLDGTALTQVQNFRTQIQGLNSDIKTQFKGLSAQNPVASYAQDIQKALSEFKKIQNNYLNTQSGKQFTNGGTRPKAWSIADNLTKAFDAGDMQAFMRQYEALQKNLNSYQGSGSWATDFKAQMDIISTSMKSFDGDMAKYKTQIEQFEKKISGLYTKGLFDKLGVQNFGSFGSQLEQAAVGLQAIQTQANQAASALSSAQGQVQQLASRMKYFFSLTSGFNLLKRGIKSAVSTVKELDKALTDIAVVNTENTVSSMWDQLPTYTAKARELGASIKDMINAQTLYIQQGLGMNQAMGLAVETMKMARIAGMDASAATNSMTAALRGFNMEVNETSATRINDVYSKLAQNSASNTQELSTAMSKVASIANSANMSFENTASFLAQIIETTREGAETAGTALIFRA